jgi:hypothetical protein
MRRTRAASCPNVRKENDMALSYPCSKGSGPVSAKYARGGPEVTSRSRFMKVPDTFRTSIQKQDYGKTGKTGAMSKPIEKAVKS